MSELITINAIIEEGGSAVNRSFSLEGNPVVPGPNGSNVLLPNQTQWLGEENITGKVVDRINLERTYPKANGTFYGVMRPKMKRTKSVVVALADGSVKTVPAYLAIDGSIPVGMSINDRLTLVNQVAAFLGLALVQGGWLTECKIENF